MTRTLSRREVMHISFPISVLTWPSIGESLTKYFQEQWYVAMQFVSEAGEMKMRGDPTEEGTTVERNATLYIQLFRDIYE